MSESAQIDIFPARAPLPPAWRVAPRAPTPTPTLAPTPAEYARLRAAGGAYHADFISAEIEAELLAAIDAATGEWRAVGESSRAYLPPAAAYAAAQFGENAVREAPPRAASRRTQHYGYRYDYAARNLAAAHIGALPAWVRAVTAQLTRAGIFAAPPQQLIVNEYQPGQGIAAHTDRDCFGEVVASLSLGADCLMQMLPNPRDSAGKFEIALQRRSLLVLRGESRARWRHGIARRQKDTQQIGGVARHIPRQRRISLTFRTIA